MTIANDGGPAREVRVMGTLGPFGWVTPTPPTTYWRSGESRTYRLSMPLVRGEVLAFVEARGQLNEKTPALAGLLEARPARFELATSRSGGERSIH